MTDTITGVCVPPGEDWLSTPASCDWFFCKNKTAVLEEEEEI